ncbi:thioesterase II family protein [Thermoflavimicrobium daqui]|jgi:surfactin synthase thioesterase subunit|uniref:Putative thioesterase n=1 Tax=Thermoflavimicrobium daqui TaxID=2137476 RepID=A0A364K7I7_9BACL|nr:alpha/beta fold hydrolase [Thermoflavimicrobium daqui]RAL26259.1 putative thioesterase [Thermoflavimicrobium daqui]
MQTTTPWLWTNHRIKEAKLHLFCFPYAGGNPVIFRSWQEKFPASIGVIPVCLPGRGMRMAEPSYTDLYQLIHDLAEAMLPYLTKPFMFFGHSMGALVSYELARYLQARYQVQPEHLIVSAFRAPHLPDPNPPIYHLPDEEFLHELSEMNGMPKEILENKELLDLFLPTLRTDFQICETYTHRPGLLLNYPITVLGGKYDPDPSIEILRPWKEHTSSTCKLQVFDGDHFFIHAKEEEVIQFLCEMLTTWLESNASTDSHVAKMRD